MVRTQAAVNAVGKMRDAMNTVGKAGVASRPIVTAGPAGKIIARSLICNKKIFGRVLASAAVVATKFIASETTTNIVAACVVPKTNFETKTTAVGEFFMAAFGNLNAYIVDLLHKS